MILSRSALAAAAFLVATAVSGSAAGFDTVRLEQIARTIVPPSIHWTATTQAVPEDEAIYSQAWETRLLEVQRRLEMRLASGVHV
jgi:hypothetical protein